MVATEKGIAAGYGRRSKDKKAATFGRNVTHQKAECRTLAKVHGETIPDGLWFVDNDCSASMFARRKRTEWQRLLDAIEHGDVRRIYTVMFDRLVRLPDELEKLITYANRGQFEKVITQSFELDLRTTAGITMARTMANMADMEARNLSERLKRTQRRLTSEGKRTRGIIGVGFVGYDGTTLNEVEAERVRDAARRVCEGVTLSTIAREWSGEVAGIAPILQPMKRHLGETATTWQPNNVRQTLLSPRNAGLIMAHGEVVGKLPVRIYDERLWRRVKQHFEAVGTRKGHKASKWTGFVVCGGTMPDGSPCGANMLQQYASNGMVTFKCAQIAGRRACGRNYANGPTLEAAAYAWIHANADTADFREMLAADDNTKREALDDVAAVQERRGMLAEAFADPNGPFRTAADYQRATRKLDELEADALKRLQVTANADPVTRWLGKGDQLAAVLTATGDAALTAEEHRALFMATRHRAYVLPATKAHERFTRERIVFATDNPAARPTRKKGRAA